MFEESADSVGLELVKMVQEISKPDSEWTLLSYSPHLSFIHDKTFLLKVFSIEKVHDKALPPKGHTNVKTE